MQTPRVQTLKSAAQSVDPKSVEPQRADTVIQLNPVEGHPTLPEGCHFDDALKPSCLKTFLTPGRHVASIFKQNQHQRNLEISQQFENLGVRKPEDL